MREHATGGVVVAVGPDFNGAGAEVGPVCRGEREEGCERDEEYAVHLGNWANRDSALMCTPNSGRLNSG